MYLMRGDNITVSSGSLRKNGHTYMFMGWESDGAAPKNTSDLKIIVTLRDMTAGKIITRCGFVKLMGKFGEMWLDSLEGCKNVFINVERGNVPCKVRKNRLSNGVGYTLTPI